MARLHRPYIPYSVRVAVAERQVRETGSPFWPLYLSACWEAEQAGKDWSLERRLRALLSHLFPDGECELDHDPSLEQRDKRITGKTIVYIPDANDPEHLLYRSTALHLQKTTGRKPGASKTVTSKGSDTWLRKKFNRLEGRTKRRKIKIPSRPFAKGKRKLSGKVRSPLFGKPRARK